METDEIKLVIPKENGVKYVLKFDPHQVADSVNATPEEFDGEDGAEMNAEAIAEEDGEFDEEKMPFNVTFEVHREGINKYASLEAEVSPSVEGEGYDLYISEMYICRDGNILSGPSYDTLDDDLRDQFDQLVNKNFRRFMPLVADYSKAKDAQHYGKWLEDLREIATGVVTN